MDHAQFIGLGFGLAWYHDQAIAGAELQAATARKNYKDLVAQDLAQPAHERLKEHGQLVDVLDTPLNIFMPSRQVCRLLYSCSFSATHALPSQTSAGAEGSRCRLTSPQMSRYRGQSGFSCTTIGRGTIIL